MSGETSHQENIGPYRLLARLGDGGGTVHRATGPDGRDVAIRLLPAGAARPDIERMRGVLSPYVVDVLDGDPAADPPYLVSRFVPGRPLGDVVAERGPMDGAELRRMALGLARALAAIHQEGLVHGVLDPGTVLVVDGAPVVVDFGLAAEGDAARDVHAWAALVAFAATGGDPRSAAPGAPGALAGVPEPLRPLLLEASAADPAVRPTAAALAEASAALDLGPGTSASARLAPSVPSDVPAPRHASAPPPAEPAAPARSAASAASEPPVSAGRDRHALSVTHGWSRLLAATVVVIAVGIVIMMPVAGLVLTVAAVTVLRAAAAVSMRDWLLALGRTALTLPYAAVLAVAVPLGLVAVSAVGGEIDALSACAFGAGAGAAVLWTAPGVRAPRRELERLFLVVAPVPRRIAVAGVVLGVLALLAVLGAMSLTPSFAPLYGLQSSLEGWIDRAQAALR